MTVILSTACLTLALLAGLAAAATAQDAPMQIKGATTVNARQIFDLLDKYPSLVILDIPQGRGLRRRTPSRAPSG